MLRSHRSWTRWRQSRRVKQLVRQERRLRALEDLTAHQLERVRKAERRVYPLQIPRPEHQLELEMEEKASQELAELLRPKVEPLPEPMPDPEETLEPMPDPTLEIAQRIGLPLRQT
jgi:hypothetical protein